MANPEHLAILKQGVGVWNEWRKKNPKLVPDLTETDLSKLDLHRYYLHGSRLNGTDLSGANLSEAQLGWADLSYANLSRADLRGASLDEADLVHTNLFAANLDGATLVFACVVEANFEKANLSNCRIYGSSAWGLKLSGAIQTNLIITSLTEPRTVDDFEIAQFIYLLVNNEKIRDVIDTVARKIVLIPGRFTPERKVVLDAIREELRKRDYLPVLFDFDKPATRDITETMRILAHLSRFIIVDISDPSSIPLELQAVVPDLAVPVQPLLLSGQREFSMFVDLRKKYHWVLATHQYTDIGDLLASLGDKVIAPAEQKAKELEGR